MIASKASGAIVFILGEIEPLDRVGDGVARIDDVDQVSSSAMSRSWALGFSRVTSRFSEIVVDRAGSAEMSHAGHGDTRRPGRECSEIWQVLCQNHTVRLREGDDYRINR